MEVIKTLEANGFEVTAISGGLFNLRSRITGAILERCATLQDLREYAIGVEYSLSQNVDKVKTPCRETGRYEIH